MAITRREFLKGGAGATVALTLGGNVGSGIGRDRTSLTALPVINEQFNLAPSGFLGGVQAGYTWQASNWVYGLEADIQGSTQRDNKTCVLTCTARNFRAQSCRIWSVSRMGRSSEVMIPKSLHIRA